MHSVIFTLFGGTPTGVHHLDSFVECLEKAIKQKSRIFRTYVSTNDRAFIITTTSKDLQLKLSALESDGHFHLAMFLHLEFVREKCDQLLLYIKEIKEEGSEDGKGILVTMNVRGAWTTFTLSSAN
jgi:hypothetical protein